MKSASFVGVLVVLCACSQSPQAVPVMPGAPGVPAALGVPAPIAIPGASPAPSIVPASIPAPAAPAASDAMPVVGIAECDTYVQQACACANESRRETACRIATMSARAWARLYSVSPTSRDRLVQQCTESAGRLQTTCAQ
jgi:hypothetical protein